MKKGILIIALLILLKPIFPVLEYAVRYDYISKVLCINKDKPKLQCNGKCHLMKELAKASENDSPISSNKKITSHEVEVLFFQEINPFNVLPVYFQKTEKINSNYSNLYSHRISCAVFHPPTVIS